MVKKRRKKSPLTKTKERLWKLVSLYIRTKYSEDGYVSCVTCGLTKPIKEMQAGHFVPQAQGNAVKWVEDNIHPQCYRCNINLGGNGPEYCKFMIETYGEERVEEIRMLAHQSLKLTVDDLLELEREYKEKFDKI